MKEFPPEKVNFDFGKIIGLICKKRQEIDKKNKIKWDLIEYQDFPEQFRILPELFRS